MSKPQDTKFGLLGEGIYANYAGIKEEEIIAGLKSGKYQMLYIGELYADYGMWGKIMANEFKVRERGYCEKVLKGVFLEGKCFVFSKDVIGLWRRDWVRKSDSKLIYEYYAIVKK
jgi:hypothetical protein